MRVLKFLPLVAVLFLMNCTKDSSLVPQTQEEPAITIPTDSTKTTAKDSVPSLDESAALSPVKPGNNDVSASIQAAIGSNKDLFFPRGTYVINKPINVSGVSNLKIRGEAGTVFTTSQNNKIIVVSGNINNLSIEGISFKSTKTSTVNDAEGLLFIANYGASTVMSGITVSKCYFTNPNTQANGIKMVSEGANSMVRNLVIKENTFESIGRMAVEFQNHNTSPVRVRYTDFQVINNTFNDVGTIQSGPAPCCVSVSGYSTNGKVNANTFNEMRMASSGNVYYGIENAGTIGLETNNNTFKSSRYGYVGILGSNPVRSAAQATGQPMKSNWTIKNNVFDLKGSADVNKIRGMEINYVVGQLEISGNTVYAEGFSARFVDVQNAKITNNKFKNVRSGNVLYFDGGSNNNELSNNVIDGSLGQDHGGVVVFNKSNNNNVFGNTLIKPGNKTGNYYNIGANNNLR